MHKNSSNSIVAEFGDKFRAQNGQQVDASKCILQTLILCLTAERGAERLNVPNMDERDVGTRSSLTFVGVHLVVTILTCHLSIDQ